MTEDIRQLVHGDVLSAPSKAQLTLWLRANKTGDKRVRAGAPHDWLVGDKTGSGDRGTTNDVGVIWPPGRMPLIFSVYLTNMLASADECNGTIADVGRAVVHSLQG